MSRRPFFTPWFSVATPPTRDGWYDVVDRAPDSILTPNGALNEDPRLHAPGTSVRRYYSAADGWEWQHQPDGPLVPALVFDTCEWRGLTLSPKGE